MSTTNGAGGERKVKIDEQNGEDDINCPEDCYVAPEGSCNGYCGSSAGTCYCDQACADFGDCCDDFCNYCSDTNPEYCQDSFTYLDAILYEKTHNENGLRLSLPEINNSSREEPAGYNLFRDNNFIAFTEDTWYLDTNISSGTTYCYNLTAVYDDYQSLHTEDVCIETEGDPVDPGDVNNDGSLDVLDVVLLVNMILEMEEPNYNGDMDSDGDLTVLDIILVINIILNN